ncbi:MAG: BrnT family toxin, partial [Arenimonas sp.]|jgi:hypothetical protein
MHTERVGIEFDPDKAVANLRKHGVSFADAELALLDPHAATLEDPEAEGELRFITLGVGAAGRVLVVVWAPRNRRARLISARKASSGEREFYAQGI